MQDTTKRQNRVYPQSLFFQGTNGPYINQLWVGSPQKMGMKFEEPGAPESAYGNFIKKLAMILVVLIMLAAGSLNVKF